MNYNKIIYKVKKINKMQNIKLALNLFILIYILLF